MSGKIIGLAGRMRSGKSTLADICVKYGYKKIYFAEPLKEICADFLDISLSELNRIKNENIPIDITLNKTAVDFFSTETDIPIETVDNVINGKLIHNVRELLQFIGTDLIRSFNMNWHLNKLKGKLNKNEKYVIEDLRFPNEKAFIEDNGGDTWYIVRPNIDEVSHHPSEESLQWQDFGDKVIINNKSLSYLSMNWENFISNYDKSNKLREELMVDISLNEFKNKFDKNNESFTMLDSLFIYRYFFTYKKINLKKENITSFNMNDKCLSIDYNDYYFIIDNPLMIEDFKKIV